MFLMFLLTNFNISCFLCKLVYFGKQLFCTVLQLSGSILELENRTKQLFAEIDELTEKARNIEISQQKH